MNTSKSFYSDMTTGLFFVAGMLSFMSGQFILSTLLFGTASLTSNLNQPTPVHI
ncbi:MULTISPECIES: hypothetical protein [Methylomonas]|uniref:Uncharacterized protein n=1 Tax=Methylomonas methanica TaxID=421 RepID=A0ABY2CEZ0_METMH|nr:MULTISPECIES: hypothetical protein [Methylomonas]TCV70673.1 hypothetical protein EDE11_1692 [Methylomonas methanica]